MKKLLLVITAILFTSFVCAQEKEQPTIRQSRSGIETELYYSHHYSISNMTQVSSGNLGVGLSLEWTFPFFDKMGISGRVEYEHVFENLERIDNWQNINFMFGIFYNLPITDLILFRPEISYGGIFNDIILEKKKVNYMDQIIQFVPSFRFTNEKIKDIGLSFELSPLYAFFTQQLNNSGHYLGVRAGVNYEF